MNVVTTQNYSVDAGESRHYAVGGGTRHSEFTLWLLFMESSRSGGGGRDGEEVRGGFWGCMFCVLIWVLVVSVSKKPTKLLTLQMWVGD